MESKHPEYHRLRQAWRTALSKSNTTPTDANIRAEQEAYDALVDYVDANDLTYTNMDPRGPKGEDES